MSDATFNEGGLELILIEVAAGVGRAHAAPAVVVVVVVVMVAAAAAASLVGLVEQLFLTLGYRMLGMAPPLSNAQAVYLPHTPHHTPVGLKMDEPIERQWVR